MGPDGALWFTGPESHQVGRITTDGVITEYNVPTASAVPTGIAAGPDGNLWYAEMGFQGFTEDKIARIPACGLGLRASFRAGTLTVKFDVGINRPAVWTLSAGTGYGFTRHIASTTPPKAFSFSWANYPNMGRVHVKSRLADEKGLVFCSEWTSVNTASK